MEMGVPIGNVSSYVNIKTLASELEISETKVYALVRGGVLPKPLKLTAGCVRWSWAAVETALASLQSGGQPEAGNDPDPLMRLIRDAEARERGEDPDPFMKRIHEAQRAKVKAKQKGKDGGKP
jgi:predicted DNA-binding transcriptional regulator AlpA